MLDDEYFNFVIDLILLIVVVTIIICVRNHNPDVAIWIKGIWYH
jgi:hypothetical protein